MLMKKLAAAAAMATGFVAMNAMAYAEWKEIDIDQSPPAMRTEVMPAARAGYVWVPGYYNYGNRNYSWVPGHFEKERVGYSYVTPRYEQKEGRWGMYAGGWEARNGEEEHGGVRNKIREAKNRVKDRIKNGDKDD
jgi:hypothetical protein